MRRLSAAGDSATFGACLLVCFWLSSIGPTSWKGTVQSVAPGFQLGRGRAGILEIGEPVSDVYLAFARDRERIKLVAQFREGEFTPVLEILVPGSRVAPALVAEIREAPCPIFSIWAIEVRDSRFRTNEGLGIGSSLRELRESYRVDIKSGEGGTYAFAQEIGTSFQLSRSSPTDTALVVSVRVVGDPELVRKKRCPDR
jgi:hypothetical protein